MNGRPVFPTGRVHERSSGSLADRAELTLEVPAHGQDRKPEPPARRDRKSEGRLVPDAAPSTDLVPDSWGGIDLA